MASLKPGTRVRVIGLQGRQELNGSVGDVLRWVEPKSRWEIRLDGMDQSLPPLGLKAENLERLSPDPAKLKGGFLLQPAALADERSGPRGALVFLCGHGDSGEALRERLSKATCGAFGKQLQTANITEVIFPNPMNPERQWYDCERPGYEASEDISGIVASVEQIDAAIDKILALDIPPERIGICGFSTGGCVALHLAYGAGRYVGQLGAVACESTFLARDSVLDAAAATRFQRTRAPPLYMGHGVDDQAIQAVWVDCTRRRLGAAGIQVPGELANYRGTALNLTDDEVEQLMKFFTHHLGLQT